MHPRPRQWPAHLAGRSGAAAGWDCQLAGSDQSIKVGWLRRLDFLRRFLHRSPPARPAPRQSRLVPRTHGVNKMSAGPAWMGALPVLSGVEGSLARRPNQSESPTPLPSRARYLRAEIPLIHREVCNRIPDAPSTGTSVSCVLTAEYFPSLLTPSPASPHCSVRLNINLSTIASCRLSIDDYFWSGRGAGVRPG